MNQNIIQMGDVDLQIGDLLVIRLSSTRSLELNMDQLTRVVGALDDH